MITIGDIIPEMTLEAYHQGEIHKKIELRSLRGKWLALVFYPSDFTFICPTELEELATLYALFQKEGAEIMSVSTDSTFVHKAWHDQSPAVGKIEFPMLSDPTGKLCRELGTYIEEEGVALRGSFLFDPDGKLVAIEINHNDVGRSSEELLRKLQAAKFVREHPGEVCPAKWHPGERTLRPGADLVGKI